MLSSPLDSSVDFAVCSFTDTAAVHLVRWTPRRRALTVHPVDLRLDRAFTLAAHPGLPVLYVTALSSPGELVVLHCTEGADAPRATVAGRHAIPGIAEPCRISVDPHGRFLVLAGYGSGSIVLVTLDAAGQPGEAVSTSFTGAGPDATRQEGSHIHDAIVDQGEIIAADLGADAIRVLTPTAGALVAEAPTPAPAGSGPRHIASLGDCRFAVSGELDSSLMLFARRDGALRHVSGLPATTRTTTERNYPSTVVVDPARSLVHIANRGADTILTAAVERERLAMRGEVDSGGVRPEHLALTDGHLLVASSGDGAVTVLRLDDGIPAGDVVARAEIPGAIWIERL